MLCIQFFDDKEMAFLTVFPVIGDGPESHRRQGFFLTGGSVRPFFCHVLLFPDFFLTIKNKLPEKRIFSRM